MAISNITVASDRPQVNKVFAGLVAPAFVKAPVAMNLIHVEDVPAGQNTMTKAFKKEGSMTTATLAEATILAYDANGRRQDTAVDVVAAKTAVVTGVSDENQVFSDSTLEGYARSQASAIARGVDNSVLALYTGFTNQIDCGSTFTVDALDQAAALIYAANTPMNGETLKFVGSHKAVRQIKADIRTSGGAMWSNERFLSVFNGAPADNGFVGNLPGYDIYATSGFAQPSTNVDSLALTHPTWSIAGIFDRAVRTRVMDHGASGGIVTELTSWFYHGEGIWNDLSAVEILLTA